MSADRGRMVVLGGAGTVGAAVVETAGNLDVASEVVVADKTAGAGRDVAVDAQVDASDAGALCALFEDADTVVNCVGPFYRFGVGILEAAIEAECDYVDVCDDWEPTLEMLDLDERARAAGVRCIVGLGASPGISNMLAAKAIRALDTVETVVTGWSLEDDAMDADPDVPGSGSVNAAVEHWLHQCSGTIRVRRDAEWVDVAPLERYELRIPDRAQRPAGAGGATPLVAVSGWSVGHPEPLTLPRYNQSIDRSVNVMIGDASVIPVLKYYRWRVDHGLPVTRAARSFTKWLTRLVRFDRRTRRRQPQNTVADLRVPPLVAIAEGSRDGRPYAAIAMPTRLPGRSMASVTGTPAAIGAALLARGRISRTGVWAPEAGIDPDDFFAALAPRCDPPGTTVDDVVAVTLAVQPE